jgi:hypothetical protein
MKNSARLALAAILLPCAAFGVYAPIPEQDQGKALSYRLGASIGHDDNIFGSATNPVDSAVYNITGEIIYNGSVTDQTFVSAGYKLSLDHFADRPGKRNLSSHTLSGRFAHAFSPATNIDISDIYMINENPESLLPGLTPFSTDQSFKRNEFNLRFTTGTTVTEKATVGIKYRNVLLAYDSASLAALLDRTENLAGVELAFAFLPETKLVGEYRYQDIAYDTAANLKDKTSHFFLAGFDHNPGQNLLVSGRVGGEARSRAAGGDTSVPYIEFTTRWNYTDGSFLSGGYTYTLEEPSDTLSYTDTRVNRFFVNLQHRLSALVTAGASFTYEPTQLQGRAPVADADENIMRTGLSLSWLPNRHWTVTASYDIDRVNSDVASRDQDRSRFNLSARLSF